METKICTKCGKELPATTEYFRKQFTGKLKLKAQCKICSRKEDKIYYKKNEIKIRKVHKIYSKKHSKEKTKKAINNLPAFYIASKCKILVKDLTPELLEQKRLTILIKRELKWQKEI